MFNIKDTVVYGSHGVCIIDDITQMKLCNSIKDYYILTPVYSDKSTIFVPCDNEVLAQRMRRILSAEEIQQMIQSLPQQSFDWEESAEKRKEHYKTILAGNDRLEIMKLIRALHSHQRNLPKGKKLYAADEQALKEAEKMLYEEFSYVLDIPRDQVLPLIVG